MSATKKFLRSEPFRLERGPWKTFDPFLFCVYHKDQYPQAAPGTVAPPEHHKRGRQMGSDFSYKDGFSYYHGGDTAGSPPGFPAHPHRGLSTITITLNDCSPVDHFDNTGATGRYGKGDTQWMSALAGKDGKSGIQHNEMFPLSDEGPSTLELFQIWIKIPNANLRLGDPTYKMFWHEQIPIAKIPVEGHEGVFSEVKVVVGDYPYNLPFKPPTPPEADYAADPKSQAAIYVIQLPKKGASVKLPPMRTSTANRAIYSYIADDENYSRIKIEPANNAADESEQKQGGSIRHRQGIQVAPDVETVITNDGSGGNIGVLVISGEPLAEPTQSYGPFVGANMEDIERAFSDYRRTQFGGWPWPKPDMYHPRDTPRMSIPKKGAPVEYPPGYEPSTKQ